MKNSFYPVSCAILVGMSLAFASNAWCAEDDSAKPPAAKSELQGVRRALLICGLPGDAAHRKQFAETMELLQTGLTSNYGFAAENIQIFWGDEASEKDSPAVARSQVATRESITSAAETLQGATQSADALWVIVLGHAHYDGKQTWLNIKGPDLSHVEFGKLWAGLECREQVFFITTPVSGFFSRALSAKGRVVVTATEADQEVNETQFPHKLAKNLAEPPEMQEFDINQDGQATLLDLYLVTVRDVLQDYASNEFLATEHALLEDTGDGKPVEIQLDYLSEELGGRVRHKRPIPKKPTGEGELANQIAITLPPPKPMPPAEEKPAEEQATP